MTQTIFLVHGMGHHPANWHADTEAKLRTLYARYERLSAVPFDNRFKIVPIQYDNVFRNLVKQWQQNAQALGQVAAGVGANEVESLVGWLKNAAVTDNNVVWTHAADVLLYRLFFTVRQEVKTSVARDIATELNNSTGVENWSVIAHSLGTAVVHDALDMLSTGQPVHGAATGLEARHSQALLLAMVANVSRVLQTQPKVYDGTVKPGIAGQAGRGCLNYMTVRHILDPFCIPKMFRPTAWPDPTSEQDGAYQYVEIDHIHQVNVHDIGHYLDNPLVHIPLFRKLTYQRSIKIAEEKSAIDSFPKFGNVGDNVGVRIKEALEDIAPGVNSEWKEYKKFWDQFDAVLGAF